MQLDHIALGVKDTQKGVEWVREQTGAAPQLHDPEPGQWYWSGSLKIAENSYLEILGPNPSSNAPHPFKALLNVLSAPQLLFWYIAVSDFKAFEKIANAAGATIDQIQSINVDGAHAAHAGYWRGVLGPGFMTARPNIIEWVHKPESVKVVPAQCQLTDFRLSNPKASELNRLFAALGIETQVVDGPSQIGLTIATPKGPWKLESNGIEWGT